MVRRLILLSVIILGTMAGLVWMGYRAIELQADGLAGKRLGQFADVAEHIRSDVMRKLDAFMQTETGRDYTEYLPYYVPQGPAALQSQMLAVPSPLGVRLDHGLAYGYFQVESDGRITLPNDRTEPRQESLGFDDALALAGEVHKENLRQNLLPALNGSPIEGLRASEAGELGPASQPEVATNESEVALAESQQAGTSRKAGRSRGGKQLSILSLQNSVQQTQVLNRGRGAVAANQIDGLGAATPQAAAPVSADIVPQTAQKKKSSEQADIAIADEAQQAAVQNQRIEDRLAQSPPMMPGMGVGGGGLSADTDKFVPDDTVQIRIEPLVPRLAPAGPDEANIFGGQVFLLRHVQIEDNHFVQGFKLNQRTLLDEVEESTARILPDDMRFEISQWEDEQAAYTAILDFGFGDLVLNLKDIDPGWIRKQIGQLRTWYFTIIGVVFLAVTMGLVSVWRNMRGQIRLAQKKDDFISAVSHELRTPLTSIRMYTEMLEKNWVKSEDKRREYYRTMRQESERLSRLIENVLDFSRLQRGSKTFDFQMGDVNGCIDKIVEMMTPYAEQAGFTLVKNLTPTEPFAFDGDAVMQIMINLIDNAVKYARGAEDKVITLRTRSDGPYLLIEVEDHGPGIPHRQRQKVFDEFYRCEDEARRESTGVGLGLALVNRFARAHNGFVEVLAAKPSGAILRVALATQQ